MEYIETKVCKKCTRSYPVEDFSKNKSRGGRPYPYCKRCYRNYSKNWRGKHNKSGKHVIYYLPEEHVVGASHCLNQRLADRRQQGFITEGWEIVYSTNSLREASVMEAWFHDHGYNGRGLCPYEVSVGWKYERQPKGQLELELAW